MGRDWVQWHADYDDPGSSLSRRLAVVRRYLERALAETPASTGARRLIGLCAGDGRDVLPVLARRGRDVRAVLVELNPELGERARTTAAELGLIGADVRTGDTGPAAVDSRIGDSGSAGIDVQIRDAGPARVEVRIGDAGLVDMVADVVPAHIVTACGVFGNVSDVDMRRTVAALPSLLVGGGVVVWTRGHGGDGPDPSSAVRACLAEHGFEEMAFARPDDASFRVGMHRLTATAGVERPPPRLFSFV